MITAELVRELLEYSPETGLFRWKERPSRSSWKAIWPGKVAGSLDSKGYLRFQVAGRTHKAHRLAWLYVHGEWPKGEIDHIDGDRSNNAIANLRVATARQNQQNKTAKVNASGFRGVSKMGRKWRALVTINGRRTHVGIFDTPEAASAAYEAAAAEHYGEFAYKGRSA